MAQVKSIRRQILEKLKTDFEAITAGPDDDDYKIAWSEVTRKPINQLAVGRRAVLGIYPTEELKVDKVSMIRHATMRVVFEAHLTRDVEQIEDFIEDALMEIERKLMEDYQLGGLAVDVRTLQSETNIDGTFDNYANCAVVAEITYRHMRAGPHVPLGS